jgi:hypothetical protein
LGKLLLVHGFKVCGQRAELDRGFEF